MEGEAVLPVLALEELEQSIKKEHGRKKLATGAEFIDNVLSGGLCSSHVTCISGDKGSGKSTITLHFLASFLLSGREEEAVVIDSTGSFDLLRLHQILISRTATAQADAALDRLQIIRVFDFEGLVEAVDEIKQRFEGVSSFKTDLSSKKGRPGDRREIPDSEDEEDDEETVNEVEDTAAMDLPRSNTGFIVIDNLTSPVNSMIKRNYVHAQAQLTTFMRSLSLLTKKYDITTLLLNGIMRQPIPSRLADHTQNESIPFPSIFEANTLRPAPGHSLTHFVDFHSLLSLLPKSERDVKILQSEQSRSTSLLVLVQRVHVLEIYTDRYGPRVGKWVAFTIEKGLELGNVV